MTDEDFISRNERMNSIDPYYRRDRQDSNAIAAMGLLCIGIIIGMVVLGTIRACDSVPGPVAAKVGCVACHYTEKPILNTGKKYKRFWHAKTAAEKTDILAELMEAER